MIVRTLEECREQGRMISAETWDSTRMVLANDKVGFSFHITRIFPGTETPIWYQNHFEAVYCVKGNGEIETCADGKVYKIEPGTMYLLDQHDKHLLRGGTEEMELVCTFNPGLHGTETHDENGVYPLEADSIE